MSGLQKFAPNWMHSLRSDRPDLIKMIKARRASCALFLWFLFGEAGSTSEVCCVI